MQTAYASVVDALFTHASAAAALDDVLVLDGESTTQQPGDYLMIGSSNADEQGAVSSGTSRQSWANVNGTKRDEEGEVNCLAVSWNGDGDLKQARSRAFAILEAVAELCKAEPSLGVPELMWTSFGTFVSVSQAQDVDGAMCLVEFQVLYRARI